ncbi:MAG: arylsulfotransferase family protein [Pseudomonadota bacterium]
MFRRVELWFCLLLALTSGLFFSLWTWRVVDHDAFPRRQIDELRAVLIPTEADTRTLFERLSADLSFHPYAFEAVAKPDPIVDSALLSRVTRGDAAKGLLPPLDSMTFANVSGVDDHLLIFGSFPVTEAETHWGILHIDPNGQVQNGWQTDIARGEFDGGHIGFAMSADGVLATNTNGILSAHNWCGRTLWEAEWSPHPDGERRQHDRLDGYDWHHDVTYHDGAFYSFRGQKVIGVSATTGEILSQLDLVDVMRWAWKDGLDLLSVHAKIESRQILQSEDPASALTRDPFHVNKVDVLSPKLADAFPEFAAGDMLLSLRELNLVIVVRPSERKIIWWRQGLTSRQHDVTFALDENGRGVVELFNNDPFGGRPAIRRLALDDHSFQDILQLNQWNMHMPFKGNFVRRGDRVITVDDESGRAILGRLSGQIEMIFHNAYTTPDEELLRLQLRNALFLSADYIAQLDAQCSQ